MVRDLAVLESLNQQVLDALPSGILFCDTDYIVRRVNACYAALLGGKVSSILGRPLTELNPATRAPIVIKNGKPELGDLCTLPLFGDNYKFVVNRVPVRDNQGDVIGMVSHILFTDPNELKELHDKIDLLQKKKKIYNKSNNSSCTRYNVDSIVGESRKIVEIKRQIKIYAADTLFLDEIGDIPLHAQVKLLRALEEQEILRVGAVSPVKVDFRLITATNRDLNAMVGEGTFREDLYYRINALRIYMPPLCERGDDILLLARHILSKIGYLDIDFTEKAARAMSVYEWPGNVRQLFNALVHASIHCTDKVIDIKDLPNELVSKNVIPDSPSPVTAHGRSLSDYMESQEANYLLSVLQKNNGNVSKTAQELGITRVTLYGKFKRYGIRRSSSGRT